MHTSNLTCPACRSRLTPFTTGAIEVDLCRGGCGGIWFDGFELRRVDQPSEPVDPVLLDPPFEPAIRVNTSALRTCPRCGDLPMQRHHDSIRRAAVVDECPRCGGIWLDRGELARVRSAFTSDAERESAADAAGAELLSEVRSMPTRERREDEELIGRLRRLARRLRFLAPSHYRQAGTTQPS